jgi:hypothetical protein
MVKKTAPLCGLSYGPLHLELYYFSIPRLCPSFHFELRYAPSHQGISAFSIARLCPFENRRKQAKILRIVGKMWASKNPPQRCIRIRGIAGVSGHDHRIKHHNRGQRFFSCAVIRCLSHHNSSYPGTGRPHLIHTNTRGSSRVQRGRMRALQVQGSTPNIIMPISPPAARPECCPDGRHAAPV